MNLDPAVDGVGGCKRTSGFGAAVVDEEGFGGNMVDLFVGLGVGALYVTLGLGREFGRASGEEIVWWRSERLDCALRGRWGENDTRRKASVIFGRAFSESEAEDELEECSGEMT